MTKSPDAFRTISEVAEILETPAHVLRFWESRFPQIKPVKRAGGRRYYRPEDLALLSGIRRLLHDEGLTIRGVQKVLREHGVRYVSGIAEDEEADFLADVIDATPVKSSAPIPLFPQTTEAASEAEQPAPEASESPELPFPEPLTRGAKTPVAESESIAPLVDTETNAPLAEPTSQQAVAPDAAPAQEPAEAAPAAEAPADVPAKEEEAPEPQAAAPKPLPPAFPDMAEIHTHWLATDLRGLRKDAFVGKAAETVAVFQRLKALRNRVGDLGRVPRR
ncbi:MerR family transcriptional regulator (plasmid) [Pseudorhodobacter turbinis]|uniref:MerR family transcriptional regulator n=1 Tax=Pseudorhodobacter turbinis TaxID=2500533 RepID=A0A4P8EI50_9RHOB|nr:MerR family transcriptional regulator [Pseudorhodobacter turbinis]QCO56830.1 MerR family transcriptional regulator [Pseudorhodobacter turbinis]